MSDLKRISRLAIGNKERGWEVYTFAYSPEGHFTKFKRGADLFRFLYTDEQIQIFRNDQPIEIKFTRGKEKTAHLKTAGLQARINYQNGRICRISSTVPSPFGDKTEEWFHFSSEGRLQEYIWEKGDERIVKSFVYDKNSNPVLSVLLPFLTDITSDFLFLPELTGSISGELPVIIRTVLQYQHQPLHISDCFMEYILTENTVRQIKLKRQQQVYQEIHLSYEEESSHTDFPD